MLPIGRVSLFHYHYVLIGNNDIKLVQGALTPKSPQLSAIDISILKCIIKRNTVNSNGEENKMKTGMFDFRLKGCSIPHFIPNGETCDGFRVIVFPQKDHEVTLGKTYSFLMQLTREATYTIDEEVFRVAHAVRLTEVSGTEGSEYDAVVYRPPDVEKETLSSFVDDDTVRELKALKARLAG